MPHQQLLDLQTQIQTALHHAQNAHCADPVNEAITHTRNALSDAYRHIRAACDEYWTEWSA